jgi:hypothetical protein
MATHKIKVGDDETLRFTVTDADSAAVNLTGGTLVLKIAPNLSVADASATYYKEITSFTNAAGGIHDETIPDSSTGGFTARTEKIQARFIDSDGIVQSNQVDNIIIEQNLIDNV